MILVPAHYDVVWAVFPILSVALLIVSIVTLIRTKTLTDAARVGWTVVVVLLPVLGSAAWLVTLWAGRRSRPAE
ncbi:PLDc N-terminal domain-containing protein [Rathayibacter sp. VKM Ac-2835]|uniref:PLDc N-terminal domain-containing protein n=1 Tax=Rathayibacter sp. VKM Ac-2835 TaxID=2739043 RepID=UPI0015648E28|nr:PLDc N-terminal domain-containing protein [Rathayibacter sp. VKM Ac-2835]